MSIILLYSKVVVNASEYFSSKFLRTWNRWKRQKQKSNLYYNCKTRATLSGKLMVLNSLDWRKKISWPVKNMGWVVDSFNSIEPVFNLWTIFSFKIFFSKRGCSILLKQFFWMDPCLSFWFRACLEL